MVFLCGAGYVTVSKSQAVLRLQPKWPARGLITVRPKFLNLFVVNVLFL